jgi:hypothetical protein
MPFVQLFELRDTKFQLCQICVTQAGLIEPAPACPGLRFHRHAPRDSHDIPRQSIGVGIGRERATGANLANKRGTRRVFISELLRPRAEIDIE